MSCATFGAVGFTIDEEDSHADAGANWVGNDDGSLVNSVDKARTAESIANVCRMSTVVVPLTPVAVVVATVAMTGVPSATAVVGFV